MSAKKDTGNKREDALNEAYRDGVSEVLWEVGEIITRIDVFSKNKIKDLKVLNYALVKLRRQDPFRQKPLPWGRHEKKSLTDLLTEMMAKAKEGIEKYEDEEQKRREKAEARIKRDEDEERKRKEKAK